MRYKKRGKSKKTDNLNTENPHRFLCQIQSRSLILGQPMNSSNSLFIPIEKVIFLEGKKKGMQEGNELIKIRKIRSIVLYHETSIQIP